MLPSFRPLICFVTRLNIVGFQNIGPPSFLQFCSVCTNARCSAGHRSDTLERSAALQNFSVLQPGCNCNICRMFANHDKLKVWVDGSSTLERSANFLTFLHHKFSHFSCKFIQFEIFYKNRLNLQGRDNIDYTCAIASCFAS